MKNSKRNLIKHALFFIVIIIPAFWFIYFINHLYICEQKMNKAGLIFHVNHLGVIMDGNRRWAKYKNYTLDFGYMNGTRKLLELIEMCIKERVQILTVYALALSNLKKRSQSEIDIIFNAALSVINSEEQWLIEQGVKINFIGKLEVLSSEIQNKIHDISEKTKKNKILIVNILLGYDPLDDIFHGMRTIISKLKNNEIQEEDVDDEMLLKCIRSCDIPSVDLIVRTGGYQRLSGYLPLQSIYSEIVIFEELWPSMPIEKIRQLVINFYTRERNFGK